MAGEGCTRPTGVIHPLKVADSGVKAEVDTDDAKKPSADVSGSAGSGATALSLAKEANRYVGEQAKDKLVQIRSEKSANGVTPNVWYVVFYDPTAALKATEVKFANGQMVDVKRPLRLLEATSRASEPLDRSKIKIDSDKAIKLALKEPLLEKLSDEGRLLRHIGAAGQLYTRKGFHGPLAEPGMGCELLDAGRINLGRRDDALLNRLQQRT